MFQPFTSISNPSDNNFLLLTGLAVAPVIAFLYFLCVANSAISHENTKEFLHTRWKQR